MFLALGVFITVSIISFLICLFSKEIKDEDYSMSEKISGSFMMGTMMGVITAIYKLIVWILNR